MVGVVHTNSRFNSDPRSLITSISSVCRCDHSNNVSFCPLPCLFCVAIHLCGQSDLQVSGTQDGCAPRVSAGYQMTSWSIFRGCLACHERKFEEVLALAGYRLRRHTHTSRSLRGSTCDRFGPVLNNAFVGSVDLIVPPLSSSKYIKTGCQQNNPNNPRLVQPRSMFYANAAQLKRPSHASMTSHAMLKFP